jgi:hypothetical protein
METRASSINRALDQIGDKWSLLIIGDVLWGINTFSELLARDVEYSPGPGAKTDLRRKKVRRRSSKSIKEVPASRTGNMPT